RQAYSGHCFFFQAEDGIRGATVTGVQTCALPIYVFRTARELQDLVARQDQFADQVHHLVEQCNIHTDRAVGGGCRGARGLLETRSEERRVGKECRTRGQPEHGREYSSQTTWKRE